MILHLKTSEVFAHMQDANIIGHFSAIIGQLKQRMGHGIGGYLPIFLPHF